VIVGPDAPGPRARSVAKHAFVSIAALLAACVSQDVSTFVTNPVDADRAVATITAAGMADKIGVLAHDSMRGRATPSPELDAVSAWLGTRFEALGLDPPFDGSFEQRYTIRTVSVDPTSTWATVGGADTLRFAEDLATPYGPATTDRLRTGSVSVVDLEGFGVEPALYEGRHVIVFADTRGAFRSAEGFSAIRTLGAAGAVAIWLVSRAEESAQAWLRNAELQGMQARTVVGDPALDVPVVSVRKDALARLLGREGADAGLDIRGGQTISIPDLRLTMRSGLTTIASASAPNVAAILRGSGPELASEYVVYSAHMDHVGVGSPDAQGDSIFNGADDDASGTAAVLEIAEAFAALEQAPSRSVLFLLVSGEELGLWGSRHFTEHPPMPLGSVVANLNADMVGRNWTDTIVVIGKEHSELGSLLDRVNARHPELGMTAIDDLWPDENFYARSDHYNFARKGIPVLFFFNGTHEDYHKVSDEVERIDSDKAARIATLMFRLGLEVANRPDRPAWREASRRRIVEGAQRPR